MRSKQLFILLTMWLVGMSIQANNHLTEGFKIQISAPFHKGSTAHFASYWGESLYSIDSIQIPQDGKFIFENKSSLPTGQYLLHIEPNIQYELLINQQEQSDIQIELNEDIRKNKITGSSDTEHLWQYLIELSENNAQNKKLANHYIEKYKGSWFSAFLKASQPVEGEPHLYPKSNEEALENLHYIQDHFFDNIDLTDERFWRTNILLPMVASYLSELVPQQLDSIASRNSWIVEKTQNNPFCFENMLTTLVNQALTSKVMGMENVWARLAEDYIFGKSLSWIDSIQYNNLKKEYSLIELNRIGMKAQNLSLPTIDGDSINTNEVDADYLLLLFYSTSCGHCDNEINKMQLLYPKYKEQGLKIVSVNTENELTNWGTYIEQHKMQKWINIADPQFKSQYWIKYDISGTPSIYLLDKDKTIIAKKINTTTLDTYLERIIKSK